MNRVYAVEDRDFQTRPFCGLLNLAYDFVPFINRQSVAADVDDRADAIFDHRLFQFGRIDFQFLIMPIADHTDFKLRHLPDFFFERHLPEQRFHFGCIIWRFAARISRAIKKALTVKEFVRYSSAVGRVGNQRQIWLCRNRLAYLQADAL